MLMALGISNRDVYEDDFEIPLLAESSEFYRVSYWRAKLGVSHFAYPLPFKVWL